MTSIFCFFFSFSSILSLILLVMSFLFFVSKVFETIVVYSILQSVVVQSSFSHWIVVTPELFDFLLDVSLQAYYCRTLAANSTHGNESK